MSNIQLTEDEIANNRREFLHIVDSKIKRDGISKFVDEWLDGTSDFFKAPASTKYHGNYKGGLCEHSLNVYHRFEKNYENEKKELKEKFNVELNDESRAIISLFHDICKANYYKLDLRNYKNEETGKWEKKEYYAIDEKFPFGHGEKSVFLLNQYIHLDYMEAICINWHMGGFDRRVLGGDNSLSLAFEKYPLAVLFHISDMEATYFDEKVNK
ncbi:MAG: hydrolase [Clostridia bacterium]|nr:hydrolase [Clostridia bacterium]